MMKSLILVASISSLLLFSSCTDNSNYPTDHYPVDTTLKIIFVELGTLGCIPC